MRPRTLRYGTAGSGIVCRRARRLTFRQRHGRAEPTVTSRFDRVSYLDRHRLSFECADDLVMNRSQEAQPLPACSSALIEVPALIAHKGEPQDAAAFGAFRNQHFCAPGHQVIGARVAAAGETVLPSVAAPGCDQGALGGDRCATTREQSQRYREARGQVQGCAVGATSHDWSCHVHIIRSCIAPCPQIRRDTSGHGARAAWSGAGPTARHGRAPGPSVADL
jgi:hypothetical protein